jgi:hypothetical protein
LPELGGLAEDAQISRAVLTADAEWQVVMYDHHRLLRREPRKIAEALFESVPVVARIAREVKLVGQDRQELLLAADAAGNAHDERRQIKCLRGLTPPARL